MEENTLQRIVTSLENTQTPLFTSHSPPPLPLCRPSYRRSCTTGAARSVEGAGGGAAGAAR